jgi:deoxyribodipyrimidine photolyase-related protein
MVIGNFSLLAGLDPEQVQAWYLGVYIDAFEWVEAPNVVGMSQFADGGLVATKPYVSSAAYINNMSDYCASCHYKKSERIGIDACPFNSLYWDFKIRNEDRFINNPRMAMPYRQLAKMDQTQINQIIEQAEAIKEKLDDL